MPPSTRLELTDRLPWAVLRKWHRGLLARTRTQDVAELIQDGHLFLACINRRWPQDMTTEVFIKRCVTNLKFFYRNTWNRRRKTREFVGWNCALDWGIRDKPAPGDPQEILDLLPEEVAAAVKLRVLDELEWEECASALGVSRRTAINRYNLGIRQLQRML